MPPSLLAELSWILATPLCPTGLDYTPFPSTGVRPHPLPPIRPGWGLAMLPPTPQGWNMPPTLPAGPGLDLMSPFSLSPHYKDGHFPFPLHGPGQAPFPCGAAMGPAYPPPSSTVRWCLLCLPGHRIGNTNHLDLACRQTRRCQSGPLGRKLEYHWFISYYVIISDDVDAQYFVFCCYRASYQ